MDSVERFMKIINLQNMQRQCDKLFNKEGLSDDVLDMQVSINQLRHELDLPDAFELDEEYCQ